MKRSLVIPCLDEARSLPGLIERCASLDDGRTEVLLVDNGSTDRTPQVLGELLPTRPHMRSIRVEVNQGYGKGILEGLAATRGDLLGWTHADLQTDPLDAARGFALFDAAPDPERLLVKGSRRGRPMGDQVFTIGMAIFESALLGARLWDINAQPTLFHRSLFESFRDPPWDFALDLYVYAEARQKGLRVERFPVLFGPRAHGRSHWNIDWRAKARFIRRTLGYSVALRRRR